MLKVKKLKHLQKGKESLALKQDKTVLWKDCEKKAHIVGKMKLKKRAKERGSNRSPL